jgi:hypothetical protein
MAIGWGWFFLAPTYSVLGIAQRPQPIGRVQNVIAANTIQVPRQHYVKVAVG